MSQTQWQPPVPSLASLPVDRTKTEPKPAFYKLQFGDDVTGFSYYVRTLTVMIGRNCDGKGGILPPPDDRNLGGPTIPPLDEDFMGLVLPEHEEAEHKPDLDLMGAEQWLVDVAEAKAVLQEQEQEAAREQGRPPTAVVEDIVIDGGAKPSAPAEHVVEAVNEPVASTSTVPNGDATLQDSRSPAAVEERPRSRTGEAEIKVENMESLAATAPEHVASTSPAPAEAVSLQDGVEAAVSSVAPLSMEVAEEPSMMLADQPDLDPAALEALALAATSTSPPPPPPPPPPPLRAKSESLEHVDVDLGPLKSVSRNHAKINYLTDLGHFCLEIYGRNGAWVDDRYYVRGTTVPLNQGSQIQIATRIFHFILPPSGDSPPYGTPYDSYSLEELPYPYNLPAQDLGYQEFYGEAGPGPSSAAALATRFPEQYNVFTAPDGHGLGLAMDSHGWLNDWSDGRSRSSGSGSDSDSDDDSSDEDDDEDEDEDDEDDEDEDVEEEVVEEAPKPIPKIKLKVKRPLAARQESDLSSAVSEVETPVPGAPVAPGKIATTTTTPKAKTTTKKTSPTKPQPATTTSTTPATAPDATGVAAPKSPAKPKKQSAAAKAKAAAAAAAAAAEAEATAVKDEAMEVDPVPAAPALPATLADIEVDQTIPAVAPADKDKEDAKGQDKDKEKPKEKAKPKPKGEKATPVKKEPKKKAAKPAATAPGPASAGAGAGAAGASAPSVPGVAPAAASNATPTVPTLAAAAANAVPATLSAIPQPPPPAAPTLASVEALNPTKAPAPARPAPPPAHAKVAPPRPPPSAAANTAAGPAGPTPVRPPATGPPPGPGAAIVRPPPPSTPASRPPVAPAPGSVAPAGPAPATPQAAARPPGPGPVVRPPLNSTPSSSNTGTPEPAKPFILTELIETPGRPGHIMVNVPIPPSGAGPRPPPGPLIGLDAQPFIGPPPIKPTATFATIIHRALLYLPRGRGTLGEVCNWVAGEWEYFRLNIDSGWQNSIRHNLSLNKAFLKVPRIPEDDPESKGSVWIIDPKEGPKFEEKQRKDALKAEGKGKNSDVRREKERIRVEERQKKLRDMPHGSPQPHSHPHPHPHPHPQAYSGQHPRPHPQQQQQARPMASTPSTTTTTVRPTPRPVSTQSTTGISKGLPAKGKIAVTITPITAVLRAKSVIPTTDQQGKPLPFTCDGSTLSLDQQTFGHLTADILEKLTVLGPAQAVEVISAWVINKNKQMAAASAGKAAAAGAGAGAAGRPPASGARPATNGAVRPAGTARPPAAAGAAAGATRPPTASAAARPPAAGGAGAARPPAARPPAPTAASAGAAGATRPPAPAAASASAPGARPPAPAATPASTPAAPAKPAASTPTTMTIKGKVIGPAPPGASLTKVISMIAEVANAKGDVNIVGPHASALLRYIRVVGVEIDLKVAERIWATGVVPPLPMKKGGQVGAVNGKPAPAAAGAGARPSPPVGVKPAPAAPAAAPAAAAGVAGVKRKLDSPTPPNPVPNGSTATTAATTEVNNEAKKPKLETAGA